MPRCDSEQLPRKQALIGTRAGGTESESLRDCARKMNLRRRSARKKTRKSGSGSRSRSRRPSSRAATSISRHLLPQISPTLLIPPLFSFGSGGADATPHALSIFPPPSCVFTSTPPHRQPGASRSLNVQLFPSESGMTRSRCPCSPCRGRSRRRATAPGRRSCAT